MRREDIGPLLHQVSDDLPEVSLADRAWTTGVILNRRRRRTALAAVLVVVGIALAVVVAFAYGWLPVTG
jgi:CHASE2 domain-containing sensor protein